MILANQCKIIEALYDDEREEYGRMLEAWRASADRVNLTQDDMARIAASVVHPDNR